jgi:hypothetical protein
MKYKILFIITLSAMIILGTSCHGLSQSTSQQGESEKMNKHDGLTFETAVVLPAKTQSEGLIKEREWIEKNLPNARPAPPRTDLPKAEPDEEIVSFGNVIVQREGRLYSITSLQMPDGQLRDVYFDVTGYFGK